MNDPTPFLDAILEHPEDDLARLAYADWLEEPPFMPRLSTLQLDVEGGWRSPEAADLEHLLTLIASPGLARLPVEVSGLSGWPGALLQALMEPGGASELDLSADPWLRESG